MLSKQSKVLVVGQGLAGTLISFLLKEAGIDVHVISSESAPVASSVAAGMWNPVAFRRVIPTWNASKMVEALHEVYPRIEEEVGVSFLHRRNIHRFFPNEEYKETWDKKSKEPEVAPFIGATHPEKGEVIEGGYVDLNSMISSWRSKLQHDQRFEFGDFKDIESSGSKWEFNHKTFDHLIVCTGLGMLDGLQDQDWLRKNKGELLHLHEGKLDKGTILNNGKWILPLAEGGFKLGASYDWKDETLSPTEEVKSHLIEKGELLFKSPLPKIKQHLVGIRPTTKDRRPLVGTLEDHPSLSVFNGLGTRGVLIGPWCAVQLTDSLINGNPLPGEMDVNRTNISFNIF
ncbi:MAG: FAD-binding oxidoreductase [Flavobacteriales bacterium]|nr:FAD-binding oxidoreductase [Flavobacteriales bacterium]